MSDSNFSDLVSTSREFFAELKQNNTKEWFADHKAEYETNIKKPAEFLATIITEKLEDLTGTPHKSKIFRIYRDVRFSKDKTPYNTHLHIVWMAQTDKEPAPGWFLGIAPDQFSTGCGIMQFAGQDLIDFRNRLAGPDGDTAQKIITKLTKRGATIRDPELKRVPSGFDKDHPNRDLLRRKSLVFWQNIETIYKSQNNDLVAATMASFDDLKPVYTFLTNMD